MIYNIVLPNLVYGAPIDVKNQGYPSSAAMVSTLYKGEALPVHMALAPRKWQLHLSSLHVMSPSLSNLCLIRPQSTSSASRTRADCT